MSLRPDGVLDVPPPAWWTEEVSLLRAMAERFSETEIVPHYARFEKQGMVDRALWTKAGAQGLLCAGHPAEYGGAGGTYAHEAAITEALGHTGADGFGLPLHNVVASPYILNYGSEEQKQRWLPRIGPARPSPPSP